MRLRSNVDRAEAQLSSRTIDSEPSFPTSTGSMFQTVVPLRKESATLGELPSAPGVACYQPYMDAGLENMHLGDVSLDFDQMLHPGPYIQSYQGTASNPISQNLTHIDPNLLLNDEASSRLLAMPQMVPLVDTTLWSISDSTLLGDDMTKLTTPLEKDLLDL